MNRTELRNEMTRLAALADKAHARGKTFTGDKRRRPRLKNSGWVVRLGTSVIQPESVKV